MCSETPKGLDLLQVHDFVVKLQCHQMSHAVVCITSFLKAEILDIGTTGGLYMVTNIYTQHS